MNSLDTLFAWFASATVRGSLIALAVCCIQYALRRRLPAQWRYALWLPVVLVLLAPGLPQSRWSIENLLAKNSTQPLTQTVAVATEADSIANETLAASVTPAATTPRFDWQRAMRVAWLAGAVGLLGFALAGYARTIRRIRRATIQPDDSLRALLSESTAACGLRREPELLVSTAVSSPAVAGLFRPALLLPAEFPGAFTREEARLVLLHELTHLKRFDLPLNWLLCLLQAIHWCNPVLWFVFTRIRADREAACDAQVLAASTDDCRADYGHALLKLEDALAPSGLSLGFLGIFERAAGFRSRIRLVAGYRNAHPAWAALALVIIAALGLTGGTRAQEKPAAGLPIEPAPVTSIGDLGLGKNKANLIKAKLQSIVLPKLEFREVSVREALDFLQRKSAEFDTTEPDPAKRGVSFILKIDEAAGAPRPAAPAVPGLPAAPALGVNPADARITISLINIPLIEAVKYVTSLSNLKFRVTDAGVLIVPISYRGPLASREWQITSDLRTRYQLKPGSDVKKVFRENGVDFPEGTSATVSRDGRKIVVRNDESNLDMVDALLTQTLKVAGAGGPPNPGAGLAPLAIERKLDAIKLPRLQIKDATVVETLDFLRRKSIELDKAEPNPANKGVNFVLKWENGAQPPANVPAIPGLESIPAANPVPGAAPEKRITLSLENVSLRDALKQVAAAAQLSLRVESDSVTLTNTPAAPNKNQ